MKRSLWLAWLVVASVSIGLIGLPAGAARPDRPAPRTGSVEPRAALGPVTLGRVAPTGTSTCIDDYLWLQAFKDAFQPSYSVPYSGVVTSVLHFANANAAHIQAVFVRPTPTDFVYDVAHRSPVLTLTPNGLNTFPVRIPVEAGEVLALRTVSGAARCEATGGTVDQDYLGGLDATATSWGPPVSSHTHTFVNISAVLEPDLDGDGYGDVSQDGCPSLASTHDPCPAPAVTVTKKPAKRITKPKVKLRFTSNVAGSTYGCSVDGRAFKPCHSPYKGRFLPGTHTVRILATSPVGVAGQPVTVQFKVVKPKR